MSFADVEVCDECGEFAERNDKRRERGLSVMCADCSLATEYVLCYFCHEWEHPSKDGEQRCLKCDAPPIPAKRTHSELDLLKKLGYLYFDTMRANVEMGWRKAEPQDSFATDYGRMDYCENVIWEFEGEEIPRELCGWDGTMFMSDFGRCPMCNFRESLLDTYITHLEACKGDSSLAQKTFPRVVARMYSASLA